MVYSSHQQLRRRTGKSGTSRRTHLHQLLQELHSTPSRSARHQVLANLANFAYDPINYPFFQELGVAQLFLTHLASPDPLLAQFALQGIANLCLDPYSRGVLVEGKIVGLAMGLVEKEGTAAAALTVLYYFVEEGRAEMVGREGFVQGLGRMAEGPAGQVRNLASLLRGALNR